MCNMPPLLPFLKTFPAFPGQRSIHLSIYHRTELVAKTFVCPVRYVCPGCTDMSPRSSGQVLRNTPQPCCISPCLGMLSVLGYSIRTRLEEGKGPASYHEGFEFRHFGLQSSAECIGGWAPSYRQDQKKKKQEEKGNKEPPGLTSNSCCYSISGKHLSLAQQGPRFKIEI